MPGPIPITGLRDAAAGAGGEEDACAICEAPFDEDVHPVTCAICRTQACSNCMPDGDGEPCPNCQDALRE